jgi:hypothetical protein
VNEPVKVIAQIIQEELGLPDGQIMMSYEKWIMPETKGLYVSVRYVSTKTLNTSNWFESTTNEEIQSVSLHHIIQIDLMSFDDSARARKSEVAMALASFRSQNLQEENNMQIARLPSEFVDASSLEETKFLKRFTATIAVKAVELKKKGTPYFDTFPSGKVWVLEGTAIEKDFAPVDPHA